MVKYSRIYKGYHVRVAQEEDDALYFWGIMKVDKNNKLLYMEESNYEGKKQEILQLAKRRVDELIKK